MCLEPFFFLFVALFARASGVLTFFFRRTILDANRKSRVVGHSALRPLEPSKVSSGQSLQCNELLFLDIVPKDVGEKFICGFDLHRLKFVVRSGRLGCSQAILFLASTGHHSIFTTQLVVLSSYVGHPSFHMERANLAWSLEPDRAIKGQTRK